MANFPQTPGQGDPHTEGNNTWIFDNGSWVKQSPQVDTGNVALLDPTNPAAVLAGSYGGARKLPAVPDGVSTQYDVNRWFVDALTELDSHYDDDTGGFVAGIYVGENEPGEKEHGTLWFDSSEDSLTLFLYYDPDGDPSTAAWIPAAPPVSVIEELEQLIQGLGEDLDVAELRLADLNTHGVDAPLHPQDGFIWNNSSPGIERSYMYEVGRLDGTTGWTLLSPNSRISDSAPVNPEVGDLWYEPTVSQALSVYDGTSWKQLTVGADGVLRIEDIEQDQQTQDGRLDVLENKVDQLESGPDGSPGGAAATIAYVDAQDDLKVNKSGDAVKGILSVSSEGNANDDGVRFYMKDNTGATNLTMFPSGVLTGKNVIRVNRDTGDAFQVKDATGSTVKWKVDSTGTTSAPRVILTGGSDVSKTERVIDVSAGQPGRLLFNGNTSLTWQNASVKIGRDASVDSAFDVKLDLQNNLIDNVSEFKMTHQGSVTKKFAITGELADGSVSDNFFYSYKNASGTPDAMNYGGKMDSANNLVNKKYVDDAVGGVSAASSVQKTGDTMTGTLTMNAGTNQQVNFLRGTNSDISLNGNWFISLQEANGGQVRVSKTLEMNGKEIKNVADPTTGQSAVNRRSLEGAKVVADGGYGSAQVGGFYMNDGRLYYKAT